jgi:hypothetical protein
MQKRKRQEEKCKAKEMEDGGGKDIESNRQWARAIKRVRLILPPPPSQ